MSSRGLTLVSAAAGLLALVAVGRLAVFMVSPAYGGWSTFPGSRWEINHSCLTAYYVASEAGARGEDFYDSSLYTAPDDDPKSVRKARKLGSFNVDVYEYPPPFLLLPRLCRIVTGDFLSLRPLWFLLNAATGVVAMVAVARSMGPVAGPRALLLMPLVWAALPTLSALQKGNVQLLVIAISMLAMVLFERGSFALGGALLAYATVSKLFPGMLVLYLLAGRQWRAFGWTTAMGAAMVLVSILDLGWASYAGFMRHLPGLLGGEAFPAFRNPSATAINLSVPGLVFKLSLFGVPGMGFPASKIVGWVWTAVAVWATVAIARRPLPEHGKPVAWMAILILATLRSPFLPQAYAAFPPLWLLTLLAALYAPTARLLALVLAGWLALNVYVPMDWGLDPRWLAVLTLVPQVLTIALAALALRRAPEPMRA